MLLSSFISRMGFKRRFVPSGNGFIYRARATAPAIAITPAERDELLRDFRGQYRRHYLCLLGVTFALVCLLAGLDLLLVPVEAAERFVSIGGFVIAIPLMIWSYWSSRRLFELPMRRFADRVPVEPGRTWADAVDAGLRRRSWPNLILSGLIVGGIGWLTFPRSGTTWWATPAWYAYFGPLAVFWLWMVFRKYQLSRSPQD